MKDDEIKELSLLDDKQTKALEWLEEHPEEREKLLETIANLVNAIGEALTKVTEQLAPTINALAALGAACAEAKRIEEEGEKNETN